MSEESPGKILAETIISAFRYYGVPQTSVLACEKLAETALYAAFRAGRIKQAEEDAKSLREQFAEATRPDQRMTLAIAIRSIERGRNLTATEKMKNLMDAMAEFDREEADRASGKEGEQQ